MSSDPNDKDLTRRGFLTRVGGGIVAANLAECNHG